MNHRSVLTFLVSAVVLISFLPAQSKYEEGNTYRHQLPNGLVVFTVERHIAPLIYHQLTYRVGSRNEHLGITGISHVVEHMMFKGTPKYGKGLASKTISKNAGVFNAFTMNDMTSYYEYLPANKIEIALDIESDRMQNCVFDTAEFRSEIRVIKQERRMRSESSSAGVMHENLNSIAYMSHPNRDPIIGWPGDLDNITREDAFTYYKTYYSPNNAFLVLVGDFETDAMLNMVKKYYGSISPSKLPRERIIVEQPQRVKKTMTLYHNDIAAPSFSFAFHVPTIRDDDGPALRAAGVILCARSRMARLYRRLVEQRQIASGAAGGMGTTKDPTLFRISVTMMKDSSIQTAEKLVWEEIKRMQDSLVSEHDLQRIKNRFTFDQVSEYTKNTQIGGRISTYETYYGLDYLKEYPERYLKVTREDIQRVMKKYFVEENVTISYGFPKNPKGKSAKKESTEEEPDDKPDGPSLLPEDEGLSFDSFFFRAPWADPMGQGSAAQDFARPKPIAPLIRKAKLDNGIPVYTIENHLTPTIFIGGIFNVGLIPEAEKSGKPGSMTLMIDVMNRGTKKETNDQLSERMAFVPFSCSVGGSYRSFYFQGNSLTKDADEMMRTGFEILTEPGFRGDDIEKLRARHIDHTKKRRQSTREVAFYGMFDQLFLNHPYSLTNPTVESLQSVSKEDILALHEKYVNPAQLTIVLVGDMTHDGMVKLANKYFGHWSKKSSRFNPKAMPGAGRLTGRNLRVFPDKEYTECTINLGFAPFNDVDPNDEETVDVLNNILAQGTLTSRMGLELRDKRGLIYGLQSQLWAMSDRIGYWKFNTKTAPKNTEEVLTVIFAEIKRLLESGVTDAEIATAKQRLFGLLPFAIETPDDIASRTFEMLNARLPLDSYDKRADRLMAVTKDDIMRVARKYFTLDRFVISVDGPIEEHSLDGLAAKLGK
jgi:zinc protease